MNFSQVTKSLCFVNTCCQDSALNFETVFMLQTDFRFRILLILLLPGFGDYSHEVTIPRLFLKKSQQWWHLGAYLFPLCPCMASRLLLRVLVHWLCLLYPLLEKTVHEWLNARLPVQQGYHDFNSIICCHWDPGSFFLPLLLQQLINVHQLLRDPAKYNLCSLASAS